MTKPAMTAQDAAAVRAITPGITLPLPIGHAPMSVFDIDVGTSAGGCPWLRPDRATLGFAYIAVYGTNACRAAVEAVARPLLCYVGTSTGAVFATPKDGDSLMELRRLTGLTWEQLARVFNVSRRTLHFWAAGKPQKSANEEKLQAILATMRQADFGDAQQNRTALRSLGSDGKSPLDLLTEGRYAEAAAALGTRPTIRSRPPRVSPEVSAQRRPTLSPSVLLDARQENLHRDPGKVLGIRRIKPRQG